MPAHSKSTKERIRTMSELLLFNAEAVIISVVPKKGDRLTYIEGDAEPVFDMYDDISECIAAKLSQQSCQQGGNED